MIIVALDLATTTGVAIGSPDAKPELRTVNFGEAGQHHGARFAEAMRFMNSLIKEVDPDLIVLEQPIGTAGGGGLSRPMMLMGLRGVVMAVAHMRHVNFEDYSVQTIRAHFIRTPRMKRVEAKAATVKMCQTLGWDPKNDDEADAAALWDLACCRQSRSHSLSRTPLFGDPR